jgi:ABC-2 type transport system permease protein
MQAERMAGFAVMFVFMTVLMLGSSFHQEQRMGTWGRILLSPAGKTAVLGGYVASMVAAGLIQFGGLAALSRLLFGIHWGALLPLAAMAAATVFCAAGLGLFLAGITRSAEQQQLLAMGIAMVTALVGGVYWSLDLMDATLRRIGHLTPQAWAMDGLRAVVLRGGQWTAVATPAAVLMTAGLLLAAGGLWRLRPE